MSNLARACMTAVVVLAPIGAGLARADDSVATDVADTCGKVLSPAVAAAWAATDGRAGRLGCPLESEGDTATSVTGARARSARFEGGEIVRHMSGALSGKAFAVAACDRLYVQYGGVSGWLGLPTSDAINTPDGQRQRFEGGTLMLTRALNTCEAERG